MEVLDLFSGKKRKRGKAHLKNLLELAMADGQFDEIEAEYLYTIAQRFNISDSELQKLKENLAQVEYMPPKTDLEKFEHLHHLIRMMMMDGEIHEKELEICKLLALRLGLKSVFVDDFVSVIGDDVRNEVPSDIIIGHLLKIAQEREHIKITS